MSDEMTTELKEYLEEYPVDELDILQLQRDVRALETQLNYLFGCLRMKPMDIVVPGAPETAPSIMEDMGGDNGG